MDSVMDTDIRIIPGDIPTAPGIHHIITIIILTDIMVHGDAAVIMDAAAVVFIATIIPMVLLPIVA